ncbi:energy transducer TonB [Bacteroides fluxus]|uniref:energy transducer TonB n=1 Tax=Bacteroides fluxus TaxID=626930 RepID=UPI00266D7D0C|nr:energy transducer TonB [Bacteroides fluxus]
MKSKMNLNVKVIIFIINSLFCVTTTLLAQPEIRNISRYDIKGDVSFFIEKQYDAQMAFGELTKGNLLETRFCRFDNKGNLIYCEIEKSGKKEIYKYEYNENGKLSKIEYPNNDIAKFSYNNERLSQIDTYHNSTLKSRIKRTYNQPSGFVDIEYNGNGKEEMRSVYQNGLLKSEKSMNGNKTYTYNAQRQLIGTHYSGRKINMGEVAMALMFANVTGDTEGISNIEGEKVTSTETISYNSKGLINKTIINGTNENRKVISNQYKYDTKGNWIESTLKYTEKSNEIHIIVERQINYFTEEQNDVPKDLDEIKYKTSLSDRKAEFPGGIEKYNEYVRATLKYPAISQELGITGKVSISYEIDRDGNATNIKVIKSADGAYLDKEGIRVIKNMPKWNPAIKDGRFVTHKDTASFTFGVH